MTRADMLKRPFRKHSPSVNGVKLRKKSRNPAEIKCPPIFLEKVVDLQN